MELRGARCALLWVGNWFGERRASRARISWSRAGSRDVGLGQDGAAAQACFGVQREGFEMVMKTPRSTVSSIAIFFFPL